MIIEHFFLYKDFDFSIFFIIPVSVLISGAGTILPRVQILIITYLEEKSPRHLLSHNNLLHLRSFSSRLSPGRSNKTPGDADCSEESLKRTQILDDNMKEMVMMMLDVQLIVYSVGM